MKLLAALVVAFCTAACVDTRDRASSFVPATADAGGCEDRDKDGFGEGCAQGGDCNDLDPRVHVGCARCATPQDGCPCEDAEKPVSCFRTPSATEDGTVIPMDVKKGDKVLFSKYAGSEVKLDGEEYLIMKEDDILGIVEK